MIHQHASSSNRNKEIYNIVNNYLMLPTDFLNRNDVNTAVLESLMEKNYVEIIC